MPLSTVALSNGAEGLFIKNDRFKTTLVTFNFYLPLREETVAPFALLPFILTSCSKKYPDFSTLNCELSKLYGARLDASCEKLGDYQLLKMSISVINDVYSLNNESLVKNACDMLLGLIFEPNTENGRFSEDDLKREKRKAVEHIKSEYSEKRIYAKTRLIEEMYKGDVYGLAKCGTVKQVENITSASLYKAWEEMLKTAYVRVHVVGATLPNGLFDEISAKFNTLDRNGNFDYKASVPTEKVSKVKTVTDTDDVSQGKLVMGFSLDKYGNDEKTLPTIIMSDIFGGGPYSKLFSNVREKMSLCYYCSSSLMRMKGLLTVESGVEADNADKAQKEILNQLDAIKKGDFSDFEFSASIKSICDSFSTYSDSQTTLETWYALKYNNDSIYTPDELAEKIMAVTREDVIDFANGVTLNTVYKLLPKEKN